MKLIISNYVGSFLRTALAGGAGFLVSKGVLDSDSSASVVQDLSSGVIEIMSGVLMYAIAQGTSLLNKKTK